MKPVTSTSKIKSSKNKSNKSLIDPRYAHLYQMKATKQLQVFLKDVGVTNPKIDVFTSDENPSITGINFYMGFRKTDVLLGIHNCADEGRTYLLISQILGKVIRNQSTGDLFEDILSINSGIRGEGRLCLYGNFNIAFQARFDLSFLKSEKQIHKIIDDICKTGFSLINRIQENDSGKNAFEPIVPNLIKGSKNDATEQSSLLN